MIYNYSTWKSDSTEEWWQKIAHLSYCLFFVGYGSTSIDKKDLLYGPTFTVDPTDVTMISKTTSLFVECRASANPPASYKWFRGPKSNQTLVSRNIQSLVIIMLFKRAAGGLGHSEGCIDLLYRRIFLFRRRKWSNLNAEIYGFFLMNSTCSL